MRRPTLDWERQAWREGRLVLGVDEAGRGPLAGPVVAAAVAFPQQCRRPKGIRDSKTLSEAQRDRAALAIRKEALAIGVGAASVYEIDRLNIRRATILAMRRAIFRVLRPSAKASPPRLRQPPSAELQVPSAECLVILDGYAMPELGLDHEAIVDGDALCVSISAAGIIAKTVRDRLMVRLAVRYPSYQWVSNRGYATEAHCRALDQNGPTPHHRRSFAPVLQLGLGLELDFYTE